MATVRPFRALRPPAQIAERVAAPPYDVIDTREARELARGNADSFLHVSRPEVDLPEGSDEHGPAAHALAHANLAAFEARGLLRADAEPRLYLYAQAAGAHRQVGLVACAAVREYLDDTIRRHENTRPDKEDDRTRHVEALGAHDEPVFLTYRAVPAIDAAVGDATRAAPEVDFVTPDGVRHTVWALPREAGEHVATLFAGVPALYIADGHHRSAAAARVHALRTGQPGEHDAFLAVLFPHDQVRILPYNRLVRDPAGRSPAELLAAIGRVMDVVPADSPEPEAPLSFGVRVGSRWYRARVRPGTFDARHSVDSLDCAIAQDQLLAPLFGIADPRSDRHIDFVGGIRGPAELERRMAAEGWSLALALYPTRVEQLIAVSDAGLLMPPKSTWFEPKLPSGLFVHRF
ncbi:MAG: DUF1015 domain-containing protein [Betaproteobacteria bacterium]